MMTHTQNTQAAQKILDTLNDEERLAREFGAQYFLQQARGFSLVDGKVQDPDYNLQGDNESALDFIRRTLNQWDAEIADEDGITVEELWAQRNKQETERKQKASEAIQEQQLLPNRIGNTGDVNTTKGTTHTYTVEINEEFEHDDLVFIVDFDGDLILQGPNSSTHNLGCVVEPTWDYTDNTTPQATVEITAEIISDAKEALAEMFGYDVDLSFMGNTDDYSWVMENTDVTDLLSNGDAEEFAQAQFEQAIEHGGPTSYQDYGLTLEEACEAAKKYTHEYDNILQEITDAIAEYELNAIMTTAAIAEEFGVDESTPKKAAASGRVPAIKSGGTWLIRRVDAARVWGKPTVLTLASLLIGYVIWAAM